MGGLSPPLPQRSRWQRHPLILSSIGRPFPAGAGGNDTLPVFRFDMRLLCISFSSIHCFMCLAQSTHKHGHAIYVQGCSAPPSLGTLWCLKCLIVPNTLRPRRMLEIPEDDLHVSPLDTAKLLNSKLNLRRLIGPR